MGRGVSLINRKDSIDYSNSVVQVTVNQDYIQLTIPNMEGLSNIERAYKCYLESGSYSTIIRILTKIGQGSDVNLVKVLKVVDKTQFTYGIYDIYGSSLPEKDNIYLPLFKFMNMLNVDSLLLFREMMSDGAIKDIRHRSEEAFWTVENILADKLSKKTEI